MNLQQFKENLKNLESISFQLESGEKVASHFHITEVGEVMKRFIDCGGTVREERKVSIQLWQSHDIWHRLEATKILKIVEIAEEKIGVGNHDIEVEYQANTIGKYGLDFDGKNFILTSSKTACLADDQCGIPNVKKSFNNLVEEMQSCCAPGSGCC